MTLVFNAILCENFKSYRCDTLAICSHMGCHFPLFALIVLIHVMFALENVNLTSIERVFQFGKMSHYKIHRRRQTKIERNNRSNRRNQEGQLFQHYESTIRGRRSSIRSLVFDIIPPQNVEILAWPKWGNYVTIPYALDGSPPAVQRDAVTWAVQHVVNSTCVRLRRHHVADSSTAVHSSANAELYCQRVQQRPSGLVRLSSLQLSSRWQTVYLLSSDGRYGALHLLLYAPDLPYRYHCASYVNRAQHRWHPMDTHWDRRLGCRLDGSQCSVSRYDSASGVLLAPDGVSGERAAPSLVLPSVRHRLTTQLSRRQLRVSHQDQHTFNALYHCAERCPQTRNSRQNGFLDRFRMCNYTERFLGVPCERSVPVLEDVSIRHRSDDNNAIICLANLLFLLKKSAPLSYCVFTVRRSSKRLYATVSLAGLAPLTATKSEDKALFTYVLACTPKMYVFNNAPLNTGRLVFDYFDKLLPIPFVNYNVSLLFWFESTGIFFVKVKSKPRMYMEVVTLLSHNCSNCTFYQEEPANFTDAFDHNVKEEEMLKEGYEDVGGVSIATLVVCIFALMGLNYVVVILLKWYWQRHYGTSSLFRKRLPAYIEEPEEEQPEDWQVNIEYSDGDIPFPMERREKTFDIKAFFHGTTSDSNSQAQETEEIKDIYISEKAANNEPLDEESKQLETLNETAKSSTAKSIAALFRNKEKKRVSFHDSVEFNGVDQDRASETETDLSTTSSGSSDSAPSASTDDTTSEKSDRSSSPAPAIEPNLAQPLHRTFRAEPVPPALDRGDTMTSTSVSPSSSSDSSSCDWSGNPILKCIKNLMHRSKN